MVFAMLFAMTGECFAVYSKVTYVQGGVRYIYSNQPEAIKASNGGYTIEQKLDKNNIYDADLYHHNYSYNNTYGVVIKNSSSSAQNIQILNKAINSGSTTLATATETGVQYGNSTNVQTVSIPANSATFILSKNVSAGQIVSGKVKFKVLGDNLTAKVVYVPTTWSALSAFNNTSRAAAANGEQSTGFFMHDTRYANVDLNQMNMFKIFAYDDASNRDGVNEYESGSNILGRAKILGNFGVTYDLQFKNAYGKTIYVTPNLISAGATQAQIVMWTAQTGWYRTPYVNKSSSEKVWKLKMPSDQHVKFMLVGGNFGSVDVEVK